MSERISTRGVSRRNFLKGTAAGALGLAGITAMTSTDGWFKPTSANAEAEETIAYMYHQYHCGGSCPFKCTVRDGRLCLMEPNPANEDDRYRVCCLKGLSEIQNVYSADRVQTPLKRVGERGEGKWESISWDEALQIFKENMEKIWAESGHDAVYYHGSSEAGQTMPWMAAILGAQTGGWTGIDQGIGNGLDPAIGPSKGTSSTLGNTSAGIGYAGMTNDSRDMVNSDYIIICGQNYVETNLMQCARFFDAKEAGAYIVTVDPHYCTTAQKSNEWVPIEPGTDAAMWLGMIRVVIDQGLYNEEFMLEKTGFPFLVGEDGMLLRVGEAVVDELTGAQIDTGDFMVWDTVSGSAVRHDAEGAMPSLAGTYMVDGKKYTTVYSKLTQRMSQYTLEWAERVTHISAAKIEEMALRYATAGAAGIITGWGGVDKMSTGDIAGHAIAVLCALCGQIGRKGAFVGCPAESYDTYSVGLAGWKFPSGLKAAAAECPPYEFWTGKTKIRAYIASGDTATQKMASMNNTVEWLKSLDFVCAMDIHHMNTCNWADLVLPVCSKFEAEDDIARVKMYNGHVMLGQKVLEPLFEARTDFRIQKDIAELFGLGDELPASSEEWVRYTLDNCTDPALGPITVDTLLAHDCVQEILPQKQSKVNYMDKFGTKSGKMELYYQGLYEFNQDLPTYEDNQEVFEGNPMKEKYPLQYCQVRTKYRLHDQFYSSSWINEVHEYVVQLNPVDMQSRNLMDFDKVHVYNDRGEMTCKVVGNESVRPGVLLVIEGVWDKCVDGGGYQYLTNSNLVPRSPKLPLGAAQPFLDTLCEVEKA